jgi:hypothetical protein
LFIDNQDMAATRPLAFTGHDTPFFNKLSSLLDTQGAVKVELQTLAQVPPLAKVLIAKQN